MTDDQSPSLFVVHAMNHLSFLPVPRFALLLALLSCVGCTAQNGGSTDAGAVREMLFVDAKSGEVIVAPVASDFPAKHPVTGERTLMPGLYCPECKRWHPVPPPDRINQTRNAANCPKTGAAMTLHGPWPGDPLFEETPEPESGSR